MPRYNGHSAKSWFFQVLYVLASSLPKSLHQLIFYRTSEKHSTYHSTSEQLTIVTLFIFIGTVSYKHQSRKVHTKNKIYDDDNGLLTTYFKQNRVDTQTNCIDTKGRYSSSVSKYQISERIQLLLTYFYTIQSKIMI